MIGETVNEVAVDPFNSDFLLAVVSDRQLFRSRDRGVSWEDAGLDLPGLTLLYGIAFDNGRSGTIYAGAGNGFFKSSDHGDNWQRLSFSTAEVIAADPHAPGVVYAAVDSRIDRTSDGGMTWESNETNVPSHPSALVVAPSNPQTLYFASLDFGHLYKSLDGGRTWTTTGTVRQGAVITSIGVDPTDADTTVRRRGQRPVPECRWRRNIYTSRNRNNRGRRQSCVVALEAEYRLRGVWGRRSLQVGRPRLHVGDRQPGH